MTSMQNQKINTLKGFRDILPPDAIKREWIAKIMQQVAESYGYEPTITPTLESLSLFEGEIGEDEKLFFKFEDQGGRKVALRYDQTVPVCRYVAANYNKLTFPFRRYQYQNVFRAEKPQKGRYREFTQFDVDIFGVLDSTADAEVIGINIETLLKIGFKKPVILLGSRSLMAGIPYEAIVAIDKLKKIGAQGVIGDMTAKGIPESQAKEYLERIQNLQPNDELKTIITYLENLGLSSQFYRFEPTLARSFSYSEGPIWELVIEDYTVGSIGGGERYDGLVNRLTNMEIPATGMAYGFDRTVEAADQLGLIPTKQSKTQVLITVFSPGLRAQSIRIASSLRQSGLNVEVYPLEAKMDRQLKYAIKKDLPFVLIIGQDEVSSNTVTLKNLATREQTTLPLEKVIKIISNGA